MTLLKVSNLTVEFPTPDGIVKAVTDVSYSINHGETLAMVGESGSGKSVSSLALMGLLPPKAAKISGSAQFNINGNQSELINLPEEQARRIRGNQIAMIFQDPMSALHPYFTIGDQIIEAHQVHNNVSYEESRSRAIEFLDLVGIPDAKTRIDSYPHQFSGGMRQRALIAMALINQPALLIADEPTTALDVTVQAQILKLFKELQAELKMALLLITHDLGVVAGNADRVNVMYAGRICESAQLDEIFTNPKMPYTQGLLASIPKLDGPTGEPLAAIPGQPPSLISLPAGCAFEPRCSSKARLSDNGKNCVTKLPELFDIGQSHLVRCHLTKAPQ
jgi:peptide/nickel transport system ATP-binding protein